RLREAQERVREVRNGVAAEVRGLEAGLPDGAALAAARQAAEQRLSGARRSAKSADATRRAAEDALGREEPRWNEWMARRERRLTELGDVPESITRADAAARELHERLEAVERAAEEERTVWVRDRQYAETKRTELLKQYEEVKEQRDQIVKLGPQGTCPTCK